MRQRAVETGKQALPGDWLGQEAEGPSAQRPVAQTLVGSTMESLQRLPMRGWGWDAVRNPSPRIAWGQAEPHGRFGSWPCKNVFTQPGSQAAKLRVSITSQLCPR